METEIDLFESIETLPNEVQLVIEKYNLIEIEFGFDYIQCNKMLKELNQLGYTFEYGLDASPYNLRKI